MSSEDRSRFILSETYRLAVPETLKDGGCTALGLETVLEDFANPVPGIGDAVGDLWANFYTWQAWKHATSRLLTHPNSSRIFRGLLKTGAKSNLVGLVFTVGISVYEGARAGISGSMQGTCK